MAYNKKLGYDPDLDYAAAYSAAKTPEQRAALAKSRSAKVAAMKASGTYDSSWDDTWNKIYNANPVEGMDSSGNFGVWGNTPVSQLGLGNNTKTTTKQSSYSTYTPTAYQSNTTYQSNNPYVTAQNQAQDRLANAKQTQINQVNRLYDNQAKQAYIQREQNKANLPTQLAAQGITGGMAESTAARINTAYGNQLATNEAARMNAITDINIAADQQAIDMALQYADRIIAQQNADRNYNLARDQFQTGVDQWNKTFAYQQGRDAVSDARYANEWQYQLNRDAIADQRYNQEWDYQRARDTISDQRYDQEWAASEHQRALDNAYRDLVRNDQLTQQEKDNIYRELVRLDNLRQREIDDAYTANNLAYNRALTAAEASGDYSGMKAFGWTDRQVQQANSALQGTVSNEPYSLGSFAKNIVDAYKDSDGQYDIANALKTALSSGQITPQDYNAALILAGVNPQAQANTANAYAKTKEWTDNIANLGYGPITESKLEELIAQGLVEVEMRNGKLYYRRK